MIDFGKYEFVLSCDHPNWTTDKRHIEIIYEFLMRNDFKRVVEIGSYTGYSTAAFIEALNHGKDFKLHIVEPTPTRHLKTVISMCKKPNNVVLHVQNGKDVLNQWTDFDFVFVDGNHAMAEAGAELLMILRHKVPNIMAHDTNIYTVDDKNHYCWGSELIGRVLWSHEDYHCVEDKEKRAGAITERGFLFASREEDKYNIGKEIFKELC